MHIGVVLGVEKCVLLRAQFKGVIAKHKLWVKHGLPAFHHEVVDGLGAARWRGKAIPTL